MKIHLLFFASLRDVIGASELELEFSGFTVREALNALNECYPQAAGHLARAQAAVNEEYAPVNTPLHEGDVLALIPPVSGGAR